MTSLSCVVIGEGSVAQSSIRHLLSVGFDVKGVFTNSEHLVQFCRERNIRVFERSAQIEECVTAKSFDYLFSINNPRILSSSILSLARRLSINYHDSPLPAYAGVNATCWAIIKGEEQHGVSWHIVEPGIDTGDILQFQSVEISKDDSALSLNLKCLEACLEAFERLINDIMMDALCPKVQNMERRSYFGLNEVPPNLGILNLEQSTQTTYNLARALEFGNHDNLLGSPKICTSSGYFLLVTNAEISTRRDTSQADFCKPLPGTILEIVDDTLVVATPDDCLLLSVSELDGHHVALGKHTSYGLNPGSRLLSLDGLDYNIAKQIRQKEPFWRQKLKVYEPTTFFIQKMNVLSSILDHSVRHPLKCKTVKMPVLEVPVTDCSYEDLLTASFIAFLGRACCTPDVHVGLLAAKGDITPGYKLLYSDVCPGVFSIDFSSPIYDAIGAVIGMLSRHKQGKTFLFDMFYRYPELRGNKRTPHHNMVIGFEDDDDTSASLDHYAKFLSDSNILVILSRREIKIVYEDRPGNCYSHVIDVIRHFATFLTSLTTHDTSCTLLDIDMISKDEAARLYATPQNSTPESPGDLLDSFALHCLRQPKHMAVVSTYIRLTYAQLRNEIDRLSLLIKKALPYDYQLNKTCIALHLPNSVAYVVNVLTAATLECPFLPLPVDLPKDRLAFMLRDARVTLMITSAKLFKSEKFKDLPIAPIVLFEDSTSFGDLVMLQFQIDENDNVQTQSQNGLPEVYSFTSLADLDTIDEEEDVSLDPDCAYVMYTSGSTGKPKGVQVKRSGVLNMANAQIKAWNLGPEDVIAQFASIGFDATISEIFTAFLSGACLAVLHDTERLGKELTHALCSLEVTTITLPPSVLNVYGPKDFPTLKNVITAGEACTLHTATKWTSEGDVKFFNAYGPTETTVCATIYKFASEADIDGASQDLPIGKAVDGVQVYLFDHFMKPVPPDVIGEIYIGGKGVSAGYIGHATSKNKDRFVPNPLDATELLYRTGDHAIQASDGTLTYVGRLDDQVKIRGQRVDLSEIEQIILQHTKVEMAVVVKHASKHSADACIAAFIAPTFVYTSELLEYLSKALPKYMMPTYIKKMDAKDFPVTLNGKVDRKKLERDESIFEHSSNVGNSHLSHTQLSMAKLWCKVLQLDQTYAYSMHRLSTFCENGGNSLHMVLLQRAIEEEFNILLSFTDIGAASTIEDFADIIKRKKDILKAPDAKPVKNGINLKELILQDSELEKEYLNLDSADHDIHYIQSISPKNILLSGVTGFLGAFLLREILEQCDAHVCCMVRESSEVRGFSRIVSNMRKYSLWKADYGSRIAVVLSDLSQPEMGIAPDIYRALCTAVDTVFMNAAQMNFNTDYNDHRVANVIGTKEFIKFACTGRRKFIFTTSSLAVFLFPPKKDTKPNKLESKLTAQNKSQEKINREERTDKGIKTGKEKPGQRLSLNGHCTDDEWTNKNRIVNCPDDSKIEKGAKENLEFHCQNRKESVLKNNELSHNKLTGRTSGPGECKSERNIQNNKMSLRQTKSVDITLNNIFATKSPKGKKRVQIVIDTSKKTNKTPGPKRIIYSETDVIRDPTILAGGYSQSKWASEQLVFQALEHLPGGAVFRPARVSGHSATGVGPTNDLFASTMIGMEKLGVIPDMTFPFDLTPVDFCAKGMVEIILQVCKDENKEMPKAYHFFNQSTIPFRELFDGMPVDKVPLDHWRQELRKIDRDNPLLPLTPFLNSEFWDRSPDWPIFSTANTEKYVSEECQQLMLPTRDLLQVYKQYFRQAIQQNNKQ